MKKKNTVLIITLIILLISQRYLLGDPLSKYISRITLSKANRISPFIKQKDIKGDIYKISYLYSSDYISIFYQKTSNSFLIFSDSYDQNSSKLEYEINKINTLGISQNKFKYPYSRFSRYGDMLFSKNEYIDWIVTGDTTIHKFDRIEFTSDWSDLKFEELFKEYYAKADQVYYSDSNWEKVVYFNIDNGWYALDDSEDSNNVNLSPRSFEWDYDKDDACIQYKNYLAKINSTLLDLETYSFDSKKFPKNMKIDYHFEKTKYVYSPTLYPPTSFWTGILYFNLKYNNDNIRFKSYAIQEHGDYDVEADILQTPSLYTENTNMAFLILKKDLYYGTPFLIYSITQKQ